MVKKILLISLMCLIVFFACEFFLSTPFPAELTNLDTCVVLKTILTDATETSNYRMTIIKNWLCLTVENSDLPQHLYVFNADNLNFIIDKSGTSGNLAMQDANGDIIIGTHKFTSGMEYIGTFSTFSPDYYGFSYNALNYGINSISTNQLSLTQYSQDWITPTTPGNKQIDSNYEFKNLFFRDTDSGTPAFLLLIFRNLDRDTYEALKIPATDLPVLIGQTPWLQNDYPYGYEKNYFSTSDSNGLFFTQNGYILKGCSDYFYYSYDFTIINKIKKEYDDEDWVMAFDYKGEYYFRFNTRTKALYKFLSWW